MIEVLGQALLLLFFTFLYSLPAIVCYGVQSLVCLGLAREKRAVTWMLSLGWGLGFPGAFLIIMMATNPFVDSTSVEWPMVAATLGCSFLSGVLVLYQFQSAWAFASVLLGGISSSVIVGAWLDDQLMIFLSMVPWQICYGVGVFPAALRLGRIRHAARNGLCVRCGYSRSGLTSGALCPECGIAPIASTRYSRLLAC